VYSIAVRTACANAHGPGGKLAFVDVNIQGHRPAVGHVALKAIPESFQHRSSNNGSVGQVGLRYRSGPCRAELGKE
jgi:hypothetical protein